MVGLRGGRQDGAGDKRKAHSGQQAFAKHFPFSSPPKDAAGRIILAAEAPLFDNAVWLDRSRWNLVRDAAKA
jgi:hypothetical protein